MEAELLCNVYQQYLLLTNGILATTYFTKLQYMCMGGGIDGRIPPPH
jgi:hypothetical protein